ncbi:uncharacterized protein LOC141628072 [Silene latifolia]|uniref:uncharacterized protein LOC141628072 n=1 Tax=Silene latifolia TaxID=37657 RepID=UPI003D76FC09
MVDAIAGHEVLNFLDAWSGYNQIKMHPQDQEKTAFMSERETRYTSFEKLALALVNASYKLRPYFESHTIHVITNYPLKIIMRKPELSGRMTKWSVHLSGYDLQFKPRTVIKSQALADFVCDFCPATHEEAEEGMLAITGNQDGEIWTLYIDGASNARGAGVGLVLRSPKGDMIVQAIRCEFKATNNEAEYEALILGMQMESGLKVRNLRVYNDSLLVVNHVNNEYVARDSKMIADLKIATEQKLKFRTFKITQREPDQRPVKEDVHMQCAQGARTLVSHMRTTGMQLEGSIPKLVKGWDTPEDRKEAQSLNKSFPNITLRKSAPRYPQTNWQAESSNKIIVENLRKRLEELGGKLADELPLVLWSDRTTPKMATGQTRFSLVYGAEAVIPSEVLVPMHRYGCQTVEQNKIEMARSLDTVDELRESVYIRMASYKQSVARTYNKNVKIRTL